MDGRANLTGGNGDNRPQLNRNRYCHTRVKNEFECDTDPVLVSSRVDIAVYAGHVLLVGLVDSRGECPEVHFRRKLGERRRIRHVLHSDGVDDCGRAEQ